MKEIIVVVVKFNDKLLILKRKASKTFDPNRWEFISGFVNNVSDLSKLAENQVIKETGLYSKTIQKGQDFEVMDEYGKWLIHPFLFESSSDKVVLTNDHSHFKWISKEDLGSVQTVKDLDKNLVALGI